jgi:hypothetical protein
MRDHRLDQLKLGSIDFSYQRKVTYQIASRSGFFHCLEEVEEPVDPLFRCNPAYIKEADDAMLPFPRLGNFTDLVELPT